MDVWREVGPASNLNLKGKRGEKMGFSPIFLAKPTVGVYRERGEKLLIVSTIYGDRVVGIHRAKI